MPNRLELCEDAQVLAGSGWLTAALCFQSVFHVLVLALSSTVILKTKLRQKAVHTNLKILLANVVFLYYLMCIPALANRVRLVSLYHTYTDPCDLLITMWETLSVRVTFYLYLHSFPLWHLAIAVERAWATLRASGYERTSSLYGSLCAACIWFTSVGYIAFLVAQAMSDPEFLPVSSYVSFTTSRTAPLLFYGHFVLMCLELLSALVDVALLLVNRRKLKNVVPEYSLSRSYQINENIAVTLYLALPLNICNMVLYSAFVALSSWIRSRRTSMDEHDFHIAYEWAHVLMLLQVTISLLILLRFGNRVMPKAVVVSPDAQADMYFQHFRQQIGAERAVLVQKR